MSFIVSQQEHRSWVPHSIWLQHRPDIHLASSISLYLGADFNIISGGSTGHRHQYGPWLQSSAQMSSWLRVAAQATDIVRLSVVTQAMAVAGPRTQTWPLVLAGHRYLQVLRQEYGTHTCTSTRPPDGSSSLRHRHGSASFHSICITPLLHRPHCKLTRGRGTENCIALLSTPFCPHISACKCSWHRSDSKPLLSEAP